ncbi:DUF4309 domain-containing protein [Anaerobacillus alkaliphilus]|uniref:DUF4309 domain-containing protein n=1 Tax=Anaerobacillus alkaliphilus TaxID=1548597 RepID=A0A4Q0VPP0_9BACI|nr:DUF4309 domain-containing protein [Anaerobacillus alkaliphilus]RXI98446.1 DUF4309 domain-containing protein [Anaerobacillus alkaliphilus]
MKYIFQLVILSFLVACGTVDSQFGEASILVDKMFDVNTNALAADKTFISSDDLLEVPLLYSESQLTSIDEIIKSIDKVKEIKDGVFQGVLVEFLPHSLEPSIEFYTWLRNDKIELIDINKFNDEVTTYGFEMGRFYLDLWDRVDDFYVSYHDLELTEEFLVAGKLGKMYTSPITIGTSKDQVIALKGEPIVSDWYNGGILYSYNDIVYIFDENEVVKAVNMPGNRIKSILQEVPTMLGQPSSIHYSELDSILTYSYQLGNYALSFEADQETSSVTTIWLHKK